MGFNRRIDGRYVKAWVEMNSYWKWWHTVASRNYVASRSESPAGELARVETKQTSLSDWEAACPNTCSCWWENSEFSTNSGWNYFSKYYVFSDFDTQCQNTNWWKPPWFCSSTLPLNLSQIQIDILPEIFPPWFELCVNLTFFFFQHSNIFWYSEEEYERPCIHAKD